MGPVQLPDLSTFTREELVELIRILHGGLVAAQADFDALYAKAREAVALTASLGEVSP